MLWRYCFYCCCCRWCMMVMLYILTFSSHIVNRFNKHSFFSFQPRAPLATFASWPSPPTPSRSHGGSQQGQTACCRSENTLPTFSHKNIRKKLFIRISGLPRLLPPRQLHLGADRQGKQVCNDQDHHQARWIKLVFLFWETHVRVCQIRHSRIAHGQTRKVFLLFPFPVCRSQKKRERGEEMRGKSPFVTWLKRGEERREET